MKWASEHWKGVVDVAESNGGIDDGNGAHLDHVRCKKQPKIARDQKEEGDTTEGHTRSPE
jgi:hypothetical protein